MRRTPRVERASETDIAFGILIVAAFQPSGIASYRRLKIEIPNHVRLTDFDRSESIMRPNEEMWMQKLQHIKANRDIPGNFIHDGYLIHIPRVGFKITPSGYHRRMRGRAGGSACDAGKTQGQDERNG